MTNPKSSDFSNEAREAFMAYLIDAGTQEGIDFETLCASQPSIEAELRQLREMANLLEASNAETMTDRIWRRYGPEVDPNISLDGRAEQVSHLGADVTARLSKLRLKGGRYRLQSEVDRGGQGAVLRVWDEDLRRNLAMKIVLIRPDAPTPEQSVDPQALRRFLEEAQITGQLDHPGIVPVHDLGLDDDGRVYFTMKLVKGDNLRTIFKKVRTGEDDWSRTRALGVMYKVCEAMSYAHHKGVIHRDLKPANIMVGKFGAVYVMDWGLARVAGRVEVEKDSSREVKISDFGLRSSSGTESSLDTMAGDVIGTPSYMAPEQAHGDLEGMGPRSDVYAAGAMLYELLAERMPYEEPGEALNNLTIWKRVFEGPPTPLAKLAKDLPPELEAICERAMQREQRNRYANMQELAEDLRAYLENRVVRAYASGAIPEFKKWVRRNRALASTGATAVLALAAGLAVSLFLRGRAVEAEGLARDEAERANAAALAASRSAETAGQVSNFLVGLFEVSDPSEARGRSITAREILERGEARIRTELAGQPEVHSKLMVTMGSVYRSLGMYARSAALLEDSLNQRRATLGDEHVLVADAMHELGELHRLQVQVEEAEPLLRGALEMRRKLLGNDHADVASSAYELAELLRESARHDEADPFFKEALSIRRALFGDGAEVAECLNGFAFNLLRQGEFEQAEANQRESVQLLRGSLGIHPLVAAGLNDLAVLLYELQEHDEVEPLYRESLEMKRQLFGDVHPEVALGLNNLANVLQDAGELARAEEMYREALAIQLELVGEIHPDVAQAQNNLGLVLSEQGDFLGAREMFRASLATYRAVHGEEHPEFRIAFENTIRFLRRWLADRMQELGEQHEETASVALELADALLRANAYEEALQHAESAMIAFSESEVAEPWNTTFSECVMGAALGGVGQFEEAEGLLLDGLERLVDERGEDAPEAVRVLEYLVQLYAAWGRPEDALAFRARLPADLAEKR